MTLGMISFRPLFQVEDVAVASMFRSKQVVLHFIVSCYIMTLFVYLTFSISYIFLDIYSFYWLNYTQKPGMVAHAYYPEAGGLLQVTI